MSDLRRGPDRAGSTGSDDRSIEPAGAARVAARLASLGAASFAVVGIVYLLSAQTTRGQRLENALFDARAEQLRGRDTAIEILATISVWSLVAAIAAVMAIALVRGRPRLALGAGSVIGVSILATEVLKKLVLPRPPLDPSAPPWHLDNVFPSGHTTIGMATAVAFVLVVPYQVRGPVRGGRRGVRHCRRRVDTGRRLAPDQRRARRHLPGGRRGGIRLCGTRGVARDGTPPPTAPTRVGLRAPRRRGRARDDGRGGGLAGGRCEPSTGGR